MSIKIKDNTQEVLNAIERGTQRALEAIGLTAETHAKNETPVDTGRLRNSMAHVVKGDTVYIGTNVEYAKYVELGARGKAPVNMLKRAATEHSDEYKKLALEALKNT